MTDKHIDDAAIAAKKEKRKLIQAAYRSVNSEKEKARKAVWYKNNIENIKVKQAEYKTANYEGKIKAYRAANAEKIRAYQAAYRAAKKLEREAAKVKTDD